MKQWQWVKNLFFWWHLTVFLTTGTDPSRSFRMTFNVPLIMAADPLLAIRMTSFISRQNDAFPKSSFWTGQECCVRKMGNGNMTMSEESIPLMTSYRSTHNGRRSFAMTSDVPRYSAQVYNAVLRRNRISFTIGQIILFLMLQFEAIGSVTGFGEAPCDVFIIVF